MPKYARLEDDGTIAVMIESDVEPSEIFHPDVAKLYVAVSDDAEVGKLPPPKPRRKR